MMNHRKATIRVVALVWAVSGLWVQAQTQPSHVHYEKPEGFGQPAPNGQIAPRLQNLGDYKFAVTTTSEQAQVFFNQGFNLAYGFNHAEAARAFAEAARLDPQCAMAYWGQALVLGPNINAPMDPANEPAAFELVQKAVALKEHASPRERAYIDALSKRYSSDEKPDRPALDRAYATAMEELHRAYPDDLDAATLYAESLMDLRPWSYWTRDDRLYPETAGLIDILESVIAKNPNHPGALHFYVHAIEPTKNPERAEAAADRLGGLMPGAGHMVHMPSHIYLRVGRYADASEANERAILADEDYLSQCRAQGIYPLAYYPHNIHFLWAAATMEGRSQTALSAARKVADSIPAEALESLPLLEGFLVVPYFAMTRFGRWDEILATPEPSRAGPLLFGIEQYARGMAFAAKGLQEEARAELRRLATLAADPEAGKIPLWSGNTTGQILKIAQESLAGEMAAREGDYGAAIARLEYAVRLQDGLIYTEPPDWHYPVRHSLGAALLEAGRAAEAETVYWDDLARNQDNGWALFGLMQSQRAQGKTIDAALTEARFKKAWARADVTLTSSRF